MKHEKIIFASMLAFGVLMFSTVSNAGKQGTCCTEQNPVYSKLVYPGADGRLVYTPDEKGNTIPDFSYAGYGGGGVKIPDVPVKIKISPVEGDNVANVQAAIDKISSFPLDKNGFRGALLLKKGKYSLSKPVHLTASGVVLRGEGMGKDGTILFGAGNFGGKGYSELNASANLVIVEGKKITEIQGSARKILDDYVPVGARTFRVEKAGDFKTGDRVLVSRHGNQEWIHEIGMDQENKEWAWEPFDINFDRIVEKVENGSITVDAPIVCAIETKWGGGEVIKYDDSGRIMNVGVENIRGESDFNKKVRINKFSNIDRPDYTGYEYYSDEDHYWNFISMDNVENGWIRDVSAYYFASSTVLIYKGCKWITIQDCVTREQVSVAGGGRRFTYNIQGQQCLVQRCFSDKGRHSFVLSGFDACGPNAFLDCEITRPYSTSEPHYKFVTGCLYDNIKAPLSLRYWKDISIGWAGANCVLWNCEGMFLVQKPPTAQNYSIGHIGIHAVVFNNFFIDLSKENGYIESLDEHVKPGSLYLTQLKERLGMNAVKNITVKEQLKGLEK